MAWGGVRLLLICYKRYLMDKRRVLSVILACAIAIVSGLAMADQPQRRVCKYLIIADKDCTTYDVGDIYCICTVGGCPSYQFPIWGTLVCDSGEAGFINYDGPNACKYGDPCAQP